MTKTAVGLSFRPGELEVHPDGTGNLIGSWCRNCGAHFFPVREACSRCLSDDLETVPFSTRGTLYTYSVVHQSTPSFEVPYVLGYVDFPEGVRIMGQITGCGIEDIRIGMPLVLSLEPWGEDDEGNPLIGYRFRPAEVDDD
ncbi:MAG: Zn-ribbon domain-containing OB-fold protein [Acidimicrobiia bacterium]